MSTPPAEFGGPAPVQDLTGSTVGRFTIRARLGTGGMGEVYSADDTTLKRPVALKRLAVHLRADQRYRQRFLREAERASALNNQHIAGIYDVLEEKGELFLVMEYVEGTNLRERLRQPLSLEQFLQIALQSADALVAAHEKGIVHRDIKPENIMLTPTGEVKILDFGVARRLPFPEDSAVTESRGSESETLSGTPAYMAPEVLLQKETDERVDIFSLGVVFYEALSGRHPFQAGGFMATTNRILNEEPAPLRRFHPRLPLELERIVFKMLAKDPAGRYATARDLMVDLRAAQSGVTDVRLRLGRRPWRWSRFLRPSLLAAALILVVAVGMVILLRERRSPIPERKNLVVLPFQPIGRAAEDQAYCDGLTETVNTKLAGISSLLVPPASQVRARGVNTIESARTQLGANLALAASWQRAGDRVRINLSLLDAVNGAPLRTATITANMTDLFALQDEVVERALRMLEVEVPPRESRELTAHGTGVLTAYDFYLQGLGYLQRFERPENLDTAITLFGRALEQDSRYALAHAGLGRAYWHNYERTKDRQWADRAIGECRAAAELDNRLAAVQVALGTIYRGTGEYEKAVEAFGRALELDPSSDGAYLGLGLAYERLRQADRAEQTYRRAIEQRPTYWAGYNSLGGFYYRQARYEEAAAMFRQMTELAPDNVFAYRNLGAAYYSMGQFDRAENAFRRALTIAPDPGTYSNTGTLYFFLGRYAEAARLFEKAAALQPQEFLYWGNLADAYRWAPGEASKAEKTYGQAIALAEQQLKVNPRDAGALSSLALYHARTGAARQARGRIAQALKIAPYNVYVLFKAAVVQNAAGNTEEALRWLERAVQAGYPRSEIQADPELTNLRAHPKFQQLTAGPKPAVAGPKPVVAGPKPAP